MKRVLERPECRFASEASDPRPVQGVTLRTPLSTAWAIAALLCGLLLSGPARAAEPAKPDAPSQASDTPAKPKPGKTKRARGSSAPPQAPRQATVPQSSQRAVCQSQCNLQRMSCDQGRAGAFQNRADQLQAAQASCYLAVQACLSRC